MEFAALIGTPASLGLSRIRSGDLLASCRLWLRHGPGSVRLAAIVDDLFVTPVAIASPVAERHRVTYPTARADLRRLQRFGIVNPLEGSQQIAYYCPAIIQVTYAD